MLYANLFTSVSPMSEFNKLISSNFLEFIVMIMVYTLYNQTLSCVQENCFG